MVNRCDSVDALRYAYYEMMRIKEENQMLEKNKDYVEMRVSSTDCAFTQNAPTQISVDGCVYTPYMRLPDPGEFYILISKEKFEKMQADNQHYREMAKQWEINYDLLLDKIGFDTVEELVNYLDSEAECDTLREAIASLEYNVKFARDERRDLSKKLDECEKDYISERDKAESLQTENEQLKKKLEEFSPDLPGYREFLTALYPEADVEKIVGVTKHIFGCRSQQDVLQSDLEYYRTLSTVQAKAIYGWKGATGCSTPEEANELLNEKERRITELHDEVKCISDKWASANSSNNSWKAAAECNSPKELIEKLNLLRDDISGRSTVTEHYKRDIEKWQKATGCLRPEDISTASLITKAMQLDQEVKILNGALQEWREGTGCPGPIAAKSLIESGASWHHAYRDVKAANEKLTDDVKSWKNVTGYSTPEDFLSAMINDPDNVWRDATGFSSTLAANIGIRDYKNTIEKLKEITECKTLVDIINGLDQEIDKWQKATGRINPEAAKQYIDRLEGRLNKIHECSVDW